VNGAAKKALCHSSFLDRHRRPAKGMIRSKPYPPARACAALRIRTWKSVPTAIFSGSNSRTSCMLDGRNARQPEPQWFVHNPDKDNRIKASYTPLGCLVLILIDGFVKGFYRQLDTVVFFNRYFFENLENITVIESPGIFQAFAFNQIHSCHGG